MKTNQGGLVLWIVHLLEIPVVRIQRFVTREDEYEDIFRDHFNAIKAREIGNVKVSIYSRMIVNERGDASW